jgi:hypothetical protein
MQQYNHQDQLGMVSDLLPGQFNRISFHYLPEKEETKAALNFHLTQREKVDIRHALDNQLNALAFKRFKESLSGF